MRRPLDRHVRRGALATRHRFCHIDRSAQTYAGGACCTRLACAVDACANLILRSAAEEERPGRDLLRLGSSSVGGPAAPASAACALARFLWCRRRVRPAGSDERLRGGGHLPRDHPGHRGGRVAAAHGRAAGGHPAHPHRRRRVRCGGDGQRKDRRLRPPVPPDRPRAPAREVHHERCHILEPEVPTEPWRQGHARPGDGGLVL